MVQITHCLIKVQRAFLTLASPLSPSHRRIHCPHASFTGNTTSFVSLHLTSAIQNAGIWGSASTGTCSVLFGLTIDGYAQMRSKEFAGDIHSLAWGANGRNLQALDSHSSTGVATSIVNFRISEDPNLGDIIATYVLVNVTDAAQIVSHPNGKRVYIVTNGTNELVTIQVQDRTNASKNAEILSRYKLLPSSLDASQFRSSSLAITAKNNTLWTFSQSPTQAVVTVFRLDSATGDVIEATARAGWSGSGDGQITAAPFESDHVVAITNSPLGYVTLLGLDQSRSTPAQDAWATHNHAYLDQLDMGSDLTTNVSLAAAKIKSYGRTVLDEFIALGESVWVD
jgi:hypothetical protein